MTTISRDTAEFPQWHVDVADRVAADAARAALVAALSPADRVAYYYANPDYAPHGTPMWVIHEYTQLVETAGQLAADDYMREHSRQQLVGELAVHKAAHGPGTGDRVLASFTGLLFWLPLTGVVSAGALVAGGPHLAGGAAAIGCALAMFSAVGRFALAGLK